MHIWLHALSSLTVIVIFSLFFFVISIIVIRVFNILFIADVPLCLPGSWSVSGDQLLTNCTECLVGFFQVYNTHLNKNRLLYITTCIYRYCTCTTFLSK